MRLRQAEKHRTSWRDRDPMCILKTCRPEVLTEDTDKQKPGRACPFLARAEACFVGEGVPRRITAGSLCRGRC